MDFQKVSFKNKELDLNLAGILYTPDNLDVSKSYPAVVVTGPMLSIKEQAQSVYAKRLAELGYVTLVFDGSYFGESAGTPRYQELPDVKETDIEGAADFLASIPYIDKNRIGGLGICGSGSYMSVAGVKAPPPQDRRGDCARHRRHLQVRHGRILQARGRGRGSQGRL